jgi:imidazolonepropionase-like amidohydrolase
MTLRRLLLIVAVIGVGAWPIGVGDPSMSLQAQGQPPPSAQGRQGGTSQGRGGGGFVAAPARRTGEGLGPFKTLVIRNVMVIDGTGAPPIGPMNVVVEGNRIARIQGAGTPGVAPGRGAAGPAGDHVIDGTGMYLMPGFVDLHVHGGGPPKNAEAEYAYKLWMAHGVTTVRGVPLADNDFTVGEKARAEKNEIVAPRIFNYQRPVNPDTPEKAREWVQWASKNGVDGLKLNSHPPEIMAALLDEAKKVGFGSTAHLAQTGVAQMNAIQAARLGLGTVTHFYGHFEALLKDYVVQPWPVDMNYNDEAFRFGQVARLWDKIHPPGSPEWKAYLEEHKKLGTVFDPTMTIYSAGRDVMRMRNADWHDKYTLPSLMDFYSPERASHGSYWYNWTTADEIAWRNFYQVWFRLVNDYKKMGGRVTTGSDSGFIYQTYGFGYILEFELLQEAGFHPLEVIQAATMNGALTLHEPKKQPLQFGIIRPGLLADMVIVDQNPLENFKVLYGTGAVRLNDKTARVERVGGIKYTIKDGIVYDAKKLLEDVAVMVEKQKKQRETNSSSGR